MKKKKKPQKTFLAVFFGWFFGVFWVGFLLQTLALAHESWPVWPPGHENNKASEGL